MKRTIIVSLWALLLLLLLAVAAGAWLLGTTTGARQILDLAERFSNGALHAETVEGRLLGPLTLRGFRFESDALQLDVGQAQLEWQPLKLMARQAVIDQVLLDGVALQLHKTQPVETTSAPDAGMISRLPLDLLLAQLRVQGLTVRSADAAPQTVQSVELSGAWIGNLVRVDVLTLDYEPLGVVELTAQAQLTAQQLELQQLQLSGAFKATAEGVWSYHADSDLRLNWQGLQWPLQGPAQIASAQGQARLQGRPGQFEVELDAALGDGGSVSVAGHWGDQIRAQLNWKDLQYPMVGQEVVAQSARGSVEVSGTLDDYHFKGDADLLTRGLPGTLHAEGRGDTESVALDAFQLAALQGQLSGTAQFAWSAGLSLRLEADARGLNPEFIAPGWPGQLNGSLKADGALTPEQPLQFDLGLSASLLRGFPLALQAQGQYSGNQLQLQPSYVRSADSRVDFRGQMLPPFDLALQVDSPQLRQFWPTLSGSLQAEATIQGALEALRVVAKAHGRSVAYGASSAEQLELDADIDLAARSRLQAVLSGVRGGVPLDRIELKAGGTLAEHELGVSATGPKLTAALTVDGAYDRSTSLWAGVLAQGRVEPDSLPVWTLAAPAALRYGDSRFGLDSACWTSDGSRACIDGGYEAGVGRAALSLQDLPLSLLQARLPPRARIDGSLSGSADLALNGGELSGLAVDLRTTAGSLQAADNAAMRWQAGSLRINDDHGDLVARLDLPLDVGGLQADVRVAGASQPLLQRRLTGQLQLDIPSLDWLGGLGTEIESARGRLYGSGSLSGTLGAPTAQAELTLEDGQFRLATPGIELTRVVLRLRSDEQRRVSIRGHARSGSGRVQLDGGYAPETGLALDLTGEDFLAANLPKVRAVVSPQLHLTRDRDAMRITGTVSVPKAEIALAGSNSGVAPTPDQVIVKPQSETTEAVAALPLYANVRVNLGKQVRLEGYGLKTRLEGGVTVVEEPGRETAGQGEIRMAEGAYEAYGQNLTIQTGKLIFSGGPVDQPGLDLRAVRRPREDILVGVRVRGTLDTPQLTVFSEPGMPQQQQLSWLLLGRSLDQSTGDERSLLASAALSLGMRGGESLARSIGEGLGLDDVSLGAREGESADGAMLTVGKYLSPKLYVSYGLGIFERSQLVRLVYDLGKGFKLATESGVDTGGDLLYTIERP